MHARLRQAIAASLLLLPARIAPGAPPEAPWIYLNWQRDPTTTMTVNWASRSNDAPDRLWMRTAGDGDWAEHATTGIVVVPALLHVRRVELTGLAPDTLYEFRLQSPDAGDADDAGTERFRTLSATLEQPLRFVTGGDMMHRREWVDAMNRRAASLDPAFALLGGDLAYDDNVKTERWYDWLASWMEHMRGADGRLIPMVVAIGNHEVRGGYNGKAPDSASTFYTLFALPEQRSYHGLDFGPYLSLLILDSAHTQPIAGAQARWLEQALAARTAQQFLFACYHYPAYGTAKAPAGGLPSDAGWSKQIREHWLPAIERHGLTAVFENDHHNYKRTHRIRAHARDDENGILYLGDGAWGVTTRTAPEPGAVWYLAKAEPRRHLFSVTLHPNGTAQIEAVDAAGEVFDRVDLATPRTRPQED